MSSPIAVTIAGSDSSGGAGIEADLKTFSALGVYGAAVVTALTAQNTKGVFGIHEVPADFIAAQTDAVFTDLDIAAVKIGMLGTRGAIDVVAAALDRYRPRNVVLDPVMVATSGERLLRGDAVGALAGVDLARAGDDAEPARGRGATDVPQARDEDEMRAQAESLLETRPRRGADQRRPSQHKLGGGAESVDLLVEAGGCLRLTAPRVATKNTHGTGCTLSSAVAAGLAKGLPLERAAREAKDYVSAAIAAADRLEVGSGRGPLHHFHAWW